MTAGPDPTRRVRRVISALFPPGSWDRVARVLATECTPAKLHSVGLLEPEVERIRLAVLRISEGQDRNLDRGVRMAQTDYRDALMGAGFGDSSAHLDWADSVASSDPLERAGD